MKLLELFVLDLRDLIWSCMHLYNLPAKGRMWHMTHVGIE